MTTSNKALPTIQPRRGFMYSNGFGDMPHFKFRVFEPHIGKPVMRIKGTKGQVLQ
jgi:hypothetical protein